jgi:hypothetical protein
VQCDPQELSKAERKALFEQQNKAKIEAAKAAKEKEKLSKAERAAIQVCCCTSKLKCAVAAACSGYSSAFRSAQLQAPKTNFASECLPCVAVLSFPYHSA